MDEKIVERVFSRGDIHQKKIDLIAMRATIFAKQNIPAGTSYEDQQKMMKKFEKKENLQNVKWPEIKIKEEEKDETKLEGNK